MKGEPECYCLICLEHIHAREMERAMDRWMDAIIRAKIRDTFSGTAMPSQLWRQPAQ